MRGFLLLSLAALLFAGGCDSAPRAATTSVKAASLAELKSALIGRKPDIALFRPRGPFSVAQRKDLAVPLGEGEAVRGDLYLSSSGRDAPLVILLHGLENSKEDHGYQGLHLATWGIHTLVVSLPNAGPWIRNGNTLARLAQAIRERPGMVDERLHPGPVLLAGHSYGASAVAVALAQPSSAVAGAILLDPAGVGRRIPAYLKQVHAPVISICADERVTLTRNRGFFYDRVPRDVITVSITNAAHEDAQFSLVPAPRATDSDAQPDEDLQLTFVSALTSAALSLGVMGGLDYAWESLDDSIGRGALFGESRK